MQNFEVRALRSLGEAVEMAGIEPACRKKFLKLSTDVDCSLFFGSLVNEQPRKQRSYARSFR